MENSFINVLGLLGVYFAILLALSLSAGILIELLKRFNWFREKISPDDVLIDIQEWLPEVSDEVAKVVAIQIYTEKAKINNEGWESTAIDVSKKVRQTLRDLGLETQVNDFQEEIAVKFSTLRERFDTSQNQRITILRTCSILIGIVIAFILNINTFDFLSPLFPDKVLTSLDRPIIQLGGILITGLVSSSIGVFWSTLLERSQALIDTLKQVEHFTSPRPISRPLSLEFSKAADELKEVDPSDIQGVAASQTKLLKVYHDEVLDQANMSFKWAIVAAIIGLIFFVTAISIFIYSRSSEIAVISTIGGVLIEFISAINFYLYSRTSIQMGDFQQRLEIIQRYLLANSLCESLEGDNKYQTRSEVIKSLVGINEGLFFPPNRQDEKVVANT